MATNKFSEIYENYTPSEKANVGKPGLPGGSVVTQEIASLGQEGSFSQVINPPYQLPTAKFNEFGGVKTDGSDTQSIDPRIDPVNGGRRETRVAANGLADTCVVSSMHGLSTFGAGAGTNSDGSDSNGSARTYATTTSMGTDATVSPGSASNGTFQPRFLPYYFAKFSLRDATGYRFTGGLTDSSPFTSDDPVVNGAFIRYSSGASDTTFKFITNDLSGGGTITDTLVTVATDTIYQVEIWLEAAAAYCRINNGTIIKNTANLPSSSTYLNVPHLGIRSTTAGTEYGLKFYKMYLSDK